MACARDDKMQSPAGGSHPSSPPGMGPRPRSPRSTMPSSHNRGKASHRISMRGSPSDGWIRLPGSGGSRSGELDTLTAGRRDGGSRKQGQDSFRATQEASPCCSPSNVPDMTQTHMCGVTRASAPAFLLGRLKDAKGKKNEEKNSPQTQTQPSLLSRTALRHHNGPSKQGLARGVLSHRALQLGSATVPFRKKAQPPTCSECRRTAEGPSLTQ